jgi:uncharacterized membrane protein
MSSRWIKVTLVISLTVNLLFIGAILGRISSGVPLTRPFPPDLGWVLRNVEPDTRQSLRAQLREQAMTSRPMRRQLRESQQTVNRLLLDDPLDQQALADSMAELRKYSTESQEEMHRSLITIMSQLDLDQRKQVMRRLNHNWRDEMRHRNRDHRPPPRP